MHDRTYASLEERPYESHYFCHETTLPHRLQDVWPQALKIGSWMSAHRLETISGEPEHAGHLQRVWPVGLGSETPLPHYHMYAIAEVIPMKLIALEVFPEKGGSYGDSTQKTSFDLIQFTDLGDSTRLNFLMIDVHLQRHAGSTFTQNRKQKEPLLRTMLDGYFENLRLMVERGGKS